MRRLLIIPLLLILVAAAGSTAQLEFIQAETQGNNVVVRWQTVQEVDVRGFELHRRAESTGEQFSRVYETQPLGPRAEYRYRDDQVYKSLPTQRVDYRLEVVYTNGTREVLAEKSVNYTSTATRRTWGSIKAMFQ